MKYRVQLLNNLCELQTESSRAILLSIPVEKRNWISDLLLPVIVAFSSYDCRIHNAPPLYFLAKFVS
jgi:hypothetical protein